MLRIRNRVFWSDSDPVPIPVFKIRSDLDSIFKIRSDPNPGKKLPGIRSPGLRRQGKDVATWVHSLLLVAASAFRVPSASVAEAESDPARLRQLQG